MIRPVLAALLLGTATLAAQTAPAPAEVPAVRLTLADATARALARNNDIALERESFHITDASVLKAAGSYDPALHLDGGYRNHTDPANSLLSGAPYGEIAPSVESVSGTASVGQLLPTGGNVSVSAYGSRDITNNFLVLLSPGYSTSLGINLRQPLLQNLSIDPARRAIRIAALDLERGTASLRRTVADTVTASSARTGTSSPRGATSSSARRASDSPPSSATTRRRRSTSGRPPNPTSHSRSPSSSAARATSTRRRRACGAPSCS